MLGGQRLLPRVRTLQVSDITWAREREAGWPRSEGEAPVVAVCDR